MLLEKDVLSHVRHERGLTQERLARRLYITRQAVSRWRRGETEAGSDMIEDCAPRMAEVMGWTVDEAASG